jgi:uncharacterized protein (UPF0333 family)
MFSKKGQSILEYSILFALVIAALAIMSVYIKRSYQGRLKQGADELSQQYSPGHTTSLITTVTSSESKTYTGGETEEGIDVPENMTVTQSKSKSTFTKKEGIDSFATE